MEDKFFNLDEVPETNQEHIVNLIKKAKYVSVTEKKDGSMIAVTRLKNDEILVNTTGNLDNEHIAWATDMLKTRYSYFYDNVPKGMTFMFELIYPEDKHVVDYYDEEAMYLLAARNLESNALLLYDELKMLADVYQLDITTSYEFTSLGYFLEKTEEFGENKEGWVFRIKGEDFDTMFKLKYKEYFILHRMITSISLMKVYKLHVGNLLNQYSLNAPDQIKEEIASHMESINIGLSRARNYVEIRTKELLAERNMTLETFMEDKEVMISFIRDIHRNETFGSEIVAFAKNPNKKDSLFKRYPAKKFEELILPEFC